MTKKRTYIIGGLILVLLICGLSFVKYKSRLALKGVESSGAVLISALEKFKEDRHKYPEDLNELVPNYLPRIDQPLWGEVKRWEYERLDDMYTLNIRPYKYDTIGYMYYSDSKSWSKIN